MPINIIHVNTCNILSRFNVHHTRFSTHQRARHRYPLKSLNTQYRRNLHHSRNTATRSSSIRRSQTKTRRTTILSHTALRISSIASSTLIPSSHIWLTHTIRSQPILSQYPDPRPGNTIVSTRSHNQPRNQLQTSIRVASRRHVQVGRNK